MYVHISKLQKQLCFGHKIRKFYPNIFYVDSKFEAKGITETIRALADKIKDRPNIFVALNKVDAIAKLELLPMVAEISQMAPWREIFMVSALKNDGIEKMLKSLADVMPQSPYLFDTVDAPDVPDELYLAELTREKIYKYIHQELPYLPSRWRDLKVP